MPCLTHTVALATAPGAVHSATGGAAVLHELAALLLCCLYCIPGLCCMPGGGVQMQMRVPMNSMAEAREVGCGVFMLNNAVVCLRVCARALRVARTLTNGRRTSRRAS